MLAGESFIAGRVPGERIETTEATTDSATFTTTETVVLSVTAPLVTGRVYRVRGYAGFASTVAGDVLRMNIREDSVSGTVLDASVATMSGAFTTAKDAIIAESEFTATSTGDKTFVATGERLSGTGTCRMEAASSRKAYLYVDYIRG